MPKAKNFFSSIFLKIFILMITLGIIVNITVIIGFQKMIVENQDKERLVARNLGKYIDYVLKDIEIPPNPKKIKELSKNIGLAIRIEYKNRSYTSEPKLPSWEEIREHSIQSVYPTYRHIILRKMYDTWRVSDEVKTNGDTPTIGKYKDRYFTYLKSNDITYIFFLPKEIDWQINEEIIISILLFLSALVIFIYIYVSKLLSPIIKIKKGVHHISNGNFDHQIDLNIKSELGDLAKSFNKMTLHIKEMMDNKEQLLYDVSHELRTPITRMKVALEFLEESPSRDQLSEDLQEMNTMVNEILESARLESGHSSFKLVSFDILPIIKELCNHYKQTPPGITIKHTLKQFIVTVNPEKTQIVLKNIIENALKYSGEAKTPIEIDMDPIEKTISIKDHGIGIPKEDIDKVFEPFYRVDKSRQKRTGGYGLGLNLCYKIMKKQQGTITIESQDGKGTKVILGFADKVSL